MGASSEQDRFRIRFELLFRFSVDGPAPRSSRSRLGLGIVRRSCHHVVRVIASTNRLIPASGELLCAETTRVRIAMRTSRPKGFVFIRWLPRTALMGRAAVREAVVGVGA